MKASVKHLYGADWEQEKARYEEIRAGFETFFGDSQEARFFSAPGRTEIGGNHTDHNHGRVLAAAINLDVVGMAKPNGLEVIRLKSVEYDRVDEVDITSLAPNQSDYGSRSLIRGICARCKELGYEIGGFDCFTKTRVLKGSGLSSSAAFEILVVTVVSCLFNGGEIDPVTAAMIAQYAENVYFGKPCGLLDQMASSVGGVTAMDFHNPQKPVIEKRELDLAAYDYALCVVDTGGNHADLTDEYAAIPAEMKKAAAFFGREFLRDVDEKEFYQNIKALRAAAGDRAVLRAMHFFDDDRLAAAEAKALEQGDFEGFLRMVRDSGRSSLMRLQNVFASSAPAEQGITLALAVAESLLQGRGACRVHGGGFAGTMQAYVPLDLLDAYREGMEKVFGEGACHVLSVRDVGGVEVEL
ncbi:galactokinase [Neglecta sp. X4]|uniref:galactokinase n=1 Tax=unclassified Neglectibacter TaxID=2632164 RepID=UPI001370C9D4|nr:MULTISPECIES: galactokinase family protein [unclassified Neglectibacter]NBI16761.1 galactokinase [Neglectibacter sp. 59]NBJ72176.1 galactokinase [Neglectibacter sp. X4]NCE80072.1 galactokinase [Neglectibacter sp. X58]